MLRYDSMTFDLTIRGLTDHGLVFLVNLGHFAQQEVDNVGGFAGSGRADEENRLLVSYEQFHQRRVSHRIDRLHQDFVEGDVFGDRGFLMVERKTNQSREEGKN